MPWWWRAWQLAAALVLGSLALVAGLVALIVLLIVLMKLGVIEPWTN